MYWLLVVRVCCRYFKFVMLRERLEVMVVFCDWI